AQPYQKIARLYRLIIGNLDRRHDSCALGAQRRNIRPKIRIVRLLLVPFSRPRRPIGREEEDETDCDNQNCDGNQPASDFLRYGSRHMDFSLLFGSLRALLCLIRVSGRGLQQALFSLHWDSGDPDLVVAGPWDLVTPAARAASVTSVNRPHRRGML